jgi:nucleotide-binding universal stress UspA family protein
LEQSFKSILIPIDGSLQSRISQEMAVFIGRLLRSQITLMHVVENELLTLGQAYILRENYVPISTATGQFPRTLNLPKTRENIFPEEVIREVTEQYREIGKEILKNSASLFAQEGIVVKEKLVEGTDIAETIIAEAEKGKYDLIIMGNSNGENELDLHLGSIAQKVALNVKASIMVVRKKGEVRKILIPVDGSEKDEKVLQKARMIAKAAESEIVLLHVQETSIFKLRSEVKEIGIQILNHTSSMIEGTQFEQKLVHGDPAKAIIETAEQADIDLIVMSSGRLGTLGRVFLGSVSNHVLHHATVPVLLVK